MYKKKSLFQFLKTSYLSYYILIYYTHYRCGFSYYAALMGHETFQYSFLVNLILCSYIGIEKSDIALEGRTRFIITAIIRRGRFEFLVRFLFAHLNFIILIRFVLFSSGYALYRLSYSFLLIPGPKLWARAFRIDCNGMFSCRLR